MNEYYESLDICANCRHYNQPSGSGSHVCRRYPPTAKLAPYDQWETHKEVFLAEYPKVYFEMTCGEFSCK